MPEIKTETPSTLTLHSSTSIARVIPHHVTSSNASSSTVLPSSSERPSSSFPTLNPHPPQHVRAMATPTKAATIQKAKPRATPQFVPSVILSDHGGVKTMIWTDSPRSSNGAVNPKSSPVTVTSPAANFTSQPNVFPPSVAAIAAAAAAAAASSRGHTTVPSSSPAVQVSGGLMNSDHAKKMSNAVDGLLSLRTAGNATNGSVNNLIPPHSQHPPGHHGPPPHHNPHLNPRGLYSTMPPPRPVHHRPPIQHLHTNLVRAPPTSTTMHPTSNGTIPPPPHTVNSVNNANHSQQQQVAFLNQRRSPINMERLWAGDKSQLPANTPADALVRQKDN